jgi:hypothetical protein
MFIISIDSHFKTNYRGKLQVQTYLNAALLKATPVNTSKEGMALQLLAILYSSAIYPPTLYDSSPRTPSKLKLDPKMYVCTS